VTNKDRQLGTIQEMHAKHMDRFYDMTIARFEIKEFNDWNSVCEKLKLDVDVASDEFEGQQFVLTGGFPQVGGYDRGKQGLALLIHALGATVLKAVPGDDNFILLCGVLPGKRKVDLAIEKNAKLSRLEDLVRVVKRGLTPAQMTNQKDLIGKGPFSKFGKKRK
jgi:hypothetical protein